MSEMPGLFYQGLCQSLLLQPVLVLSMVW